MLGVSVKEPYDAAQIVWSARERGILINSAGGNSLRLTPPLIINSSQIAQLQRVLLDVFQSQET